MGENGLLWRVKFGREQTFVVKKGWERTDCCGERRLGEKGLLWRVKGGRERELLGVKGGRERTGVEKEGWERTYCSRE